MDNHRGAQLQLAVRLGRRNFRQTFKPRCDMQALSILKSASDNHAVQLPGLSRNTDGIALTVLASFGFPPLRQVEKAAKFRS